MANEIPGVTLEKIIKVPVSYLTFMLLMPMASPSRLMRGPPELPKVIAASVCMYSGTSLPCRPISPGGLALLLTTFQKGSIRIHVPYPPELTPAVMVLERERGEPSATTHSPGLMSSLLPNLALKVIKTTATISDDVNDHYNGNDRPPIIIDA